MVRSKENSINSPAEDRHIAITELSSCPSDEILQLFQKRALPRRLRRQTSAHVKHCTTCRNKLRTLREAQLLNYEVEVFNQVLEELDASDSGSLDYLLQARREQQLYQKRSGFGFLWRLRRWWRRFW